MSDRAKGDQFELAPDVRIIVFDDEAVVFNPFTWETHVLNESATLVVERLQAGACGMTEVEELLAAVLDDTEKPLAAEHAERVLQDLASLRLIVDRSAVADAGR